MAHSSAWFLQLFLMGSLGLACSAFTVPALGSGCSTLPTGQRGWQLHLASFCYRSRPRSGILSVTCARSAEKESGKVVLFEASTEIPREVTTFGRFQSFTRARLGSVGESVGGREGGAPPALTPLALLQREIDSLLVLEAEQERVLLERQLAALYSSAWIRDRGDSIWEEAAIAEYSDELPEESPDEEEEEVKKNEDDDDDDEEEEEARNVWRKMRGRWAQEKEQEEKDGRRGMREDKDGGGGMEEAERKREERTRAREARWREEVRQIQLKLEEEEEEEASRQEQEDAERSREEQEREEGELVLKQFVGTLQRVMRDAGFLLLTQRDLALSTAVEGATRVVRSEVEVDEQTLFDLSALLPPAAEHERRQRGPPAHSRLLVWRRGVDVIENRGVLPLTKLDYAQQKAFLFLATAAAQRSQATWASTWDAVADGRAMLQDSGEALQRWTVRLFSGFFLVGWFAGEGGGPVGEAVSTGRKRAEMGLVALARKILTRWGLVSTGAVTLADFMPGGSWPPPGKHVAVRIKTVGTSLGAAVEDARRALKRELEERRRAEAAKERRRRRREERERAARERRERARKRKRRVWERRLREIIAGMPEGSLPKNISETSLFQNVSEASLMILPELETSLFQNRSEDSLMDALLPDMAEGSLPNASSLPSSLPSSLSPSSLSAAFSELNASSVSPSSLSPSSLSAAFNASASSVLSSLSPLSLPAEQQEERERGGEQREAAQQERGGEGGGGGGEGGGGGGEGGEGGEGGVPRVGSTQSMLRQRAEREGAERGGVALSDTTPQRGGWRAWVSGALRPITLSTPVWSDTVVMYVRGQPPPPSLPPSSSPSPSSSSLSREEEEEEEEERGREGKWWQRWRPEEVLGRLYNATLQAVDPQLPAMLNEEGTETLIRGGKWRGRRVSGSGAGMTRRGWLKAGSTEGVPSIVAYERVEVEEVRALWPDRRLRFRPLDSLRLDVVTVATLATVLAQVKLDNAYTQIISLVTTTAWMLGAIYRFNARRNEYELVTTRSLAEQTTARGLNVLRMVTEDALEQRQRRWRLAYAALADAQQDRAEPLSLPALVERCEELLGREGGGLKHSVALRLPLRAALLDLQRLGVVAVHKGPRAEEQEREGDGGKGRKEEEEGREGGEEEGREGGEEQGERWELVGVEGALRNLEAALEQRVQAPPL